MNAPGKKTLLAECKGKPHADVDNKESPGDYHVSIVLICEQTYSEYGCRFYDGLFKTVRASRCRKIHMDSHLSRRKRQSWFPEEGGKAWFVGAEASKMKSGKAHPTGDLCFHVIYMHQALI